MSVKHFLFVNEQGEALHSVTGPQKPPADGWIEVDAKTLNEFAMMNKPYEKLVYKNGQWKKLPDPRPVFNVIPAKTLGKVGERISINFEGGEDGEQIIEYEKPNGAIGLLKVSVQDKKATASIIFTESGYYRFRGGDNWRASEEVTIAVFEE